jgi:hypothetical protein
LADRSAAVPFPLAIFQKPFWNFSPENLRGNVTAKVIDFPCREGPGNPGNGAREALIGLALTFANTGQADAERWTDYILAEFWARGFKVVPVEGS